MSGENEYYYYVVLCIGVLSILSSFFGILTLSIIFVLKLPYNSYRTTIITITFFQLLYDLSLILYFCEENDATCEDIRGVSVVVSGLNADLWSNVLIFMVIYVVITKKIFDLHNYLIHIGISIMFIAVANGYTFMFVRDAQLTSYTIYNIIRVLSITFNVICYISIRINFYRMKLTKETTKSESNVTRPIIILANRLALYPLVQSVSRFGPLWYNLLTNETLIDFKNVSHPSLIHIIAAFCSAITSPFAGFGYFIVFLYMQKGAYEYFCSICIALVSYLSCGFCVCKTSQKNGTFTVGATTYADDSVVSSLDMATSHQPRSQIDVSSSSTLENPLNVHLLSTDTLNAPYLGTYSSHTSVDNHSLKFESMDDDELIKHINTNTYY
jgi:hypothetical protein